MLRPNRSALLGAAVLVAAEVAACSGGPGTSDEASPSASTVPDSGFIDASGDGDPRIDGGAEADSAMGDAPHASSHRVLFVGNSFIYVNDVAGHYRTNVESLPFSPVRVEEVTTGGWRFVDHAADAATDGTPLAHWLRTGRPEETAFDAVILQEQSQLGGYPVSESARRDAIVAALKLARLARDRGAKVVLYETWGYRDGDPTHDLLGFSRYRSMDDSLD